MTVPVNGLHLSRNIGPGSVFVHVNVLGLVLEICDHSQPETLSKNREYVELSVVISVVITENQGNLKMIESSKQIETNVGAESTSQSTDDALDSFGRVDEHGASGPEVTAVSNTSHCVHDPTDDGRYRVVGILLLTPSPLFEGLLSDPGMTLVLGQVTRVCVMSAVGFLPWPIGSLNDSIVFNWIQLTNPKEEHGRYDHRCH